MTRNRALVAMAAVILGGAIAYAFLVREPATTSPVVLEKPAAPGQASDAPRSAPDPRADVKPATQAGYTQSDFETSKDLQDLLIVALPEAGRGDPQAMDMVARIYTYCLLYNLSPEGFTNNVEQTVQRVPAEGAAIRAVADKVRSRCQRVNDGKMIPTKWITDLVDRSSAAGSLIATMQLTARNPGVIPDSEQAALVLMAANSNDGVLMMEAAPLLGAAAGKTLQGSPLEGSDFDQHAWAILACRRGAPCSKGQSILDWMCLSGSGCGYASFEDSVFRGRIPQADRAALEAKVRAIDAWLNRNQD